MDLFTTVLVLISGLIAFFTIAGFLAAEDKSEADQWLLGGLALAFSVFILPWALWTEYDRIGWSEWKIETAGRVSNWFWAAAIVGPIAFAGTFFIVYLLQNDKD